MLNLVPTWAHHYEEFWTSIRGRNLWFIKLRYGAVVMLTFFIVSTEFLLKIKLGESQQKIIILITATILVYNSLLHFFRRYLKLDALQFNPLHLSFVQIILDLTALMLLVYYSGGIESPLYMLAVFHMIIGSLILPSIIIYSIAVLVVLSFAFISFGEYSGIIPHQPLTGLLNFNLSNDLNYIIAFNVVFVFTIFVSVMLANRIAKQLLKQEQDLVESFEKLNTAEIEKQKYIMGVVHEIKTPLTAVHSYIELVLKKYLGPINPRMEEKLERAKLRSSEAIEMINDVLKISRLKLLDETSHEEINLNEVIENIFEKQKAVVRLKKISLKFSDERNEKNNLCGDNVLLEMAFSNLINNAVKYVTSNGEVLVTVSNGAKKNIITICDNGIGIPESEQKKIFNDFYRASNVKQKGYEGTGLGLSVVKQIIERHGGTISVESPSKLGTKEKPGACFCITLPAG
ncbi:MAG: HAMP domain-containing histidine kinase [Ignavibacteriales bacterium]|nr:MAG: HAMP domain-containing histidine kinase [Ignavibacteriales bacterium]